MRLLEVEEMNEEYRNCYHEVAAWMPLPEPYKENEDEGQANT